MSKHREPKVQDSRPTPEQRRRLQAFFRTRKGQWLSRGLAKGFIETAIEEGNLDPRGKSGEQFNRETLDYLKKVARPESQIVWNIDFRSELIRQARRLAKNHKAEESVLY